MSSVPDTTLVSLFYRRVGDDGDKTALWVKRSGKYEPVAWQEWARSARRGAAALVQLGVQPADRVILVSENRPEWLAADLAIQLAQAVHVPVHAPLTGEQIAWQIADSGARVVLLSGPGQAAKLASCAEQLPAEIEFLSFDPCEATVGGRPVRLFADLVDAVRSGLGREVERQALIGVTPDSLATILYTSGTTGEPKGVMLTQRNLASNTLATITAFGQETDDVRLTFLPLSHIFARTCDLYTWIAQGCQLALAESRESVLADCQQVRPTIMSGVPYFFEKLFRYLSEQGRAKEPHALRNLLGGRIRVCCAGGAALPDHVFDFFERQGVPLLQGYGLTESSPVITASTLSRCKRGCVGPVIPGVEVKIAADGEILTKGPHVMRGYYKNQAATDQVLKDGWLYTGDIGELDAEGFLKITGRKKEILVTSGGKNVAPVYLESLLCEDPLIAQALVVGDGKPYLAALIVPNPEPLQAEIMARQIPLRSREEALVHPQVRAIYEERIAQRLAKVSYYEQVRKFTLLGRGFSIESGEMTPKLSLRRKVIEANFSAEIASMYGKE
jgi:long-chain acyl-CoA synthetase